MEDAKDDYLVGIRVEFVNNDERQSSGNSRSVSMASSSNWGIAPVYHMRVWGPNAPQMTMLTVAN